MAPGNKRYVGMIPFLAPCSPSLAFLLLYCPVVRMSWRNTLSLLPVQHHLQQKEDEDRCNNPSACHRALVAANLLPFYNREHTWSELGCTFDTERMPFGGFHPSSFSL